MTAAEKINGFLKGLKFKKKAFGGVNPQDVLEKFAELDALYQEAFIENVSALKARLEERDKLIEEKTKLIDDLNEQMEVLKKQLSVIQGTGTNDEEKELRIELDALRIKYESAVELSSRLQKENDELVCKIETSADQQSSSVIDIENISMNETFARGEVTRAMLELRKNLIDENENEKKSVLEAAHIEAANIIKQAKLEKEQIKIQSYFDIAQIKKEKESLAKELSLILSQISDILDKEKAKPHTNLTEMTPEQGQNIYEETQSTKLFRSTI